MSHCFDATVNLGLYTANLLIRGAKQLVTLRGSRTPRCGPSLTDIGIIKDGAALICGGVIQEVGSSHRVEALAASRRAVEINAAGRVVMPGFIDCHTHLAFPSPDVPGEHREAAARAIAVDSGKRTAARWRAYLNAMARHGATTVEIKTGGVAEEDAERKLLRVLATVQHEPLDVVPSILLHLPAYDSQPEPARREYRRWLVQDFLPRIRKARLAQFADLSWDPDPHQQPSLDAFMDGARAAGFSCRVHAHGMRPGGAIALAVRHLAVSVDHLEEATASEISMLAGSPTMATLLPMASFHTGAASAPARALVDAGVAIALGSNFNARHNPTLNMQTVIALACLRMGLTPEEAISAATINAAHALGCADRRGSIELAKDADLAILNVSDYRDLASNFGANLVHATIKRGEVIYREGSILPPSGAAQLPVEENAFQ